MIYVKPYVVYNVKLEVLRGDLEDSVEKLAELKFDDVTYGECNPPGSAYDCDFFDCSRLEEHKKVSSISGTLSVFLKYNGNSHACDCDKTTWECSSKETDHNGYVADRSKIIAAARITLYPEPPRPGNTKFEPFYLGWI